MPPRSPLTDRPSGSLWIVRAGFAAEFTRGAVESRGMYASAAPGAEARAAPRLVVYTARFEILVANVADAIARFLKRVEGAGGYLERRDTERVTVRIPASEFLKVVEDLRLSEEIDRWKGELRYLSEAIAYSTIEVAFRSAAPPPQRIAPRKASRYDWVNQLGVEHVLRRF